MLKRSHCNQGVIVKLISHHSADDTHLGIVGYASSISFVIRPVRSAFMKMEKMPFLALLDYVSRAHEIAICPSSVRPSVRPSSVVRPCRNYL